MPIRSDQQDELHKACQTYQEAERKWGGERFVGRDRIDDQGQKQVAVGWALTKTGMMNCCSEVNRRAHSHRKTPAELCNFDQPLIHTPTAK
jgi:hypothetical protein